MNILVCDDNPMRHEMFVPLTWLGHTVVWVSIVSVAQSLIAERFWDMISLDHDFRGLLDDSEQPEEITGRALARQIASLDKNKRPALVAIHTMNKRGGDVMEQMLRDAGLNVCRQSLSNVFV